MGDDVVDLTFPVRGRSVAADHGYALYSALSRQCPDLHGASWLAIAPISGGRIAGGRVRIEPWSTLVLRIPVSRIGSVIQLAGGMLTVADSPLALGTPRVEPLRPSASLRARSAVVRLTRPPRTSTGLDKAAMAEAVRAELTRQLTRMGVSGSLGLGQPRELRVSGQRIVGWLLSVTDLSDADSITLQVHGLGGKRRMGCGVFMPARKLG